MRTMAVRVVLAAAVAAAASSLQASSGRATAEDDLAVVKRAVARQGEIGSPSRHVSTGEEPATRANEKDAGERDAADARSDARRSVASGRDLRWFKVRITEKGSKKARVTVNLPIALVRALGDDFPIDIGRHGRHDGWRANRGEKVIRLGEVLATLEAGQSLVEIDDDDATVRVWVE